MKFKLVLFFSLICNLLYAQQKIIVSKNGDGNFLNIQDAINSLPDTANTTRVVFIKNGLYNEKVFIKKHNLIIEGETVDGVIITQSIARDEFRCTNKDDWGVATINVRANDIALLNITVINSFGFDFKQPYEITCPIDTTSVRKITKSSHQMALRTQQCTRLRAINCNFKALGGDTVSPWETNVGMWYFKNCKMEGGVDFYCPRGWAWAENCTFYCHGGTGAIWHDGSANKESKSVLLNCTFSGIDSFYLGRYHKDAQFFLINCSFSKNMRNKEIYAVNPAALALGNRVYYFNCKKTGTAYNWYVNNLPNNLNQQQININWLFQNKWQPQ
jgi:pectinesterase